MKNTSNTSIDTLDHVKHGLIERIKRHKLFMLTVAAPTILATLYYGLIASDVYVSESRFVVRSAKPQPALNMMGALLTGNGFSQADQDTYPVLDYVESRDALRELNQNNYILDKYSKEGDFIGRFHAGINNSFEALWRYYGSHIVKITADPSSGITVLQVRAYNATDAEKINESLVKMSERLINRMNDRAASDAVDFTQREVEAAALKAKNAATALAAYRNSHAIFDPDKQSALRLQQTTALQTQLFAAQTQLAQLESLSPQNPQIQSTKTSIASLEKQINTANGVVAGDKNSFSQQATEYERLQLDSQFADKQLASTMAALENARQDAERKQLYLEELVQPNTPDIAIEPKRIRGIFTVFALGLICWAVFSLLLASIMEHRD